MSLMGNAAVLELIQGGKGRAMKGAGNAARMDAVQAKGKLGGKDVHGAAEQGTQGGGSTLPFLDRIQASFGRHDVSGIGAHLGGTATTACGDMGAEAFASGNDVAFAGSPSLHTAAHEAAHVVQQRGGVSLSGGVGQVGDQYEKHADAVADLVVQGKSAEALLDTMVGSNGGSSGAVQQRAVQRSESEGGVRDAVGVRDNEEFLDAAEDIASALGDASAACAETETALNRLECFAVNGVLVKTEFASAHAAIKQAQSYFNGIVGPGGEGSAEVIEAAPAAVQGAADAWASNARGLGWADAFESLATTLSEQLNGSGAPGLSTLTGIMGKGVITGAGQELKSLNYTIEDVVAMTDKVLGWSATAQGKLSEASILVEVAGDSDKHKKAAQALSAGSAGLKTANTWAGRFKKVEHLVEFAHAVQVIAEVDMGNAEAAAAAFDKLAETAGAVGADWLPTGLAMYANLVKELGGNGFFTKTYPKLVHSEDRLCKDHQDSDLRNLGVCKPGQK